MKKRSAAQHSNNPASRTLTPSRWPNRQGGQALIYPFTAIVGQEEMKLALVLNVIDPRIGGVLIMGHRGTGKSTAVRALADLLPAISTVRDCSYQCNPADESNSCGDCKRRLASGEKLTLKRAAISIVDLPLGATEDRVCGTIDLERALKDGIKSFEPGLLARANRGFLYIDEVNLLDDHLVDLLLDVAATGRNKVERESISIEHPARFVLIGSGNPEEGELRPQLLDRFGLHVEVQTENDLDRRVEIVERREAFESNPAEFCARVVSDQQQLRNKITRAQKNSGSVIVEPRLLRQIALLCIELKIDGHRGELTITRAARALAAFEGRKKITEGDVRQVAPMALRHRLRRDPLEVTASTERIQQALEQVFTEEQKRRRGTGSNDGDGAKGSGDDSERLTCDQGVASGSTTPSRQPTRRPGSRTHSQVADPKAGRGMDSPAEFPLPAAAGVALSKSGFSDRAQAERTQSRSAHLQHKHNERSRRISYNYKQGRYARAVNIREAGSRVAIDATLRAAASDGYRVPSARSCLLPAPDTRHLTPNLRFKQLSCKSGRLFIFAIDASGSMAANRIRQAKGAALSLLKQSYIQRDRVAIVGFRGTSAEVLLPPSRSMLRARRVLDSLGVGGGTPLTAGLIRSLEIAKQDRSDGEIILLVFTDGNANVAAGSNGSASRFESRTEHREMIEKELVGLGLALGKAGIKTFVMDSHNRYVSNGDARALAEKLGANYLTVNQSM